jgi:hypothetical protein
VDACATQEFYADVFPLGSELFSLNLGGIITDQLSHWDNAKFERTCEGVVSVLLALRKRPVIRYDKNSEMARRLAKEVHYVMSQETSLFDFRMPDSPPLLLVLDRRNDPVTPLLNQWTYQAMAHELVTIHNNLINTSAFEKDKDVRRPCRLPHPTHAQRERERHRGGSPARPAHLVETGQSARDGALARA